MSTHDITPELLRAVADWTFETAIDASVAHTLRDAATHLEREQAAEKRIDESAWTAEPGVSETGPWTCLEDVPQSVLRVTGSDGNLIGRTTDGRWARMDAARYKQIVPLDASGPFTEVIADA
ncbi:hypothetical protein [Rhodococcus ruber]|uniref:hypothetical protein n=1 Tax=Rhodococcus ruber TaxID=1830 RepID=UPI003784E082